MFKQAMGEQGLSRSSTQDVRLSPPLSKGLFTNYAWHRPHPSVCLHLGLDTFLLSPDRAKDKMPIPPLPLLVA